MKCGVGSGALLCACGIVQGLTATAFGQIRVVTYNVAELHGDLVALGEVLDLSASDDTPGFAVAPHVYVLQEVNPDAVQTLQDLLPEYAFGSFSTSSSNSSSVALFYDPALLEEVVEEHVSLPTGANRLTERWKLRLIGYESPDASFFLYGSHLKAGSGDIDELERLAGVLLIRYDADDLLSGSHVLYLGDMNFYHHQELGYQWFLSRGIGAAIDSLGSDSWAGPENAIKQTQSPRFVNEEFLSGGGLDDRFDFILLTTSFDDGAGLSLIPGSLRAIGNDGNHYDVAINDGVNMYWPDDQQGSEALANALHDASDHLPVVAEFRLPGRVDASLLESFRVILDAPFGLVLSVANGAPVVIPTGADTFSYVATASGFLRGSFEGTLAPLGPADLIEFAVDTSVVGTLAGSVTVESESQGAGSVVRTTSGTVLRPSNASLSGAEDLDALTIDWLLQPDTGVRTRQVAVYNNQFDTLQALLDIDGVTGGGGRFAFEEGLASGIGAVPASLVLSFDTTGAATGDYQASFTIDTSDEDLPGEEASTLTLNLQVTVGQGLPWAINEIRIDQPGADDDEFVELRGIPGTSLDGLTYLVIGDSTDSGTGTIEMALDLSGLAINADGLFLIAEDDDTLGAIADYVHSLNFENSDNVTHLIVEGFTGGDDIDESDDGLIDNTPWRSVIDAVGLIEEPNPPQGTEFAYGAALGFVDVGPDGDNVPALVYRCRFGGDWSIGAYETGVDDTPGAENCSTDCPADVVADGVIDVLDLVQIILGWGACEGCPADLNHDGVIDVSDLVTVIVGWGACP